MYNLNKTIMKHFNKLFAMGAALIASFFAAGNASAQDEAAGFDGTYYYDPAEAPAGYYYLVGGWNEGRAMLVEDGKLMVADLDAGNVAYIFYVTGQDKSKEENIGKLIKELGEGNRLYIYAGMPDSEKAIGGPLGSNGAIPLTTEAGKGGLYGWAEVGAAGNANGNGTSTGKTFRFSNNAAGSGKSRDMGPKDTPDEVGGAAQELWSYNNRNDWASWKLMPVSEEMIQKLKASADATAYAERIAKCIKLAEILKGYKDNAGTEAGHYDIKATDFGTTADAVTGVVDRALYQGIAQYVEESKYEERSLEWLDALQAQVLRLILAARQHFVSYPLDLEDVSIVTLQYEGQTRYSGINGGGKWENPSDFGTPGGGNGRLALVKNEDGKYLIASQALYLKITDEGQRVTAAGKTDATAFKVIRYTEGGTYTFLAENNYFLKNSQFDADLFADVAQPDKGYQKNTFNGYEFVSVQGNATAFDGAYYNSMIYPFKVQKPALEGYHTFVMTKSSSGIAVEDVDVVPAGVPFLYVTATNGDDSRMLIPQTGQEYVEGVQGENNLLDGAFISRVDGAELDALKPVIYSLATKDGMIGYLLNGGFTETTPANRAYITKAAAEADDARGGYNLKYDKEAGTLAVEAISVIYNVTYNTVYNGDIIKTETVTANEGAPVAIPASFNADFTTLEMAPGTPSTVNSDLTITINATWNPPFEPSLSTADAHWYNLDIRNGHWVRVEESEPYHPIQKADVDNNTLRSDAYQWAFMGNPYELYIYNKSTGEMTLTKDGKPVMRDGKYSWTLVANNTADAFAILETGTANNYINQEGGSGNNRVFGFWDNSGAKNDGGSTFKVYEVPSLVNEAIAAYTELGDIIDDMIENPDRYDYTFTEGDQLILITDYEDAETYAGMSDEEIEAVIGQIKALIDRIKASYIVFDTKAVVTIQITAGDGGTVGGGIGINGGSLTDSNWGNNFGNPNGTQGRWCIERQADNTYTLMTRGEYITGMTAGEKAAHSNNAEEALHFTIKAYNDGYTIQAPNGLYLGNNIKAFENPQTAKFNSWNNSNANNQRVDIDRTGADENGLHWAALVIPFSVTAHEGTNLYTVNKQTRELEEQTVIPGGTPFLYSFADEGDPARRLEIVQDAADIVFAALPAETTFLSGSYMSNANPGRPEGVFALGIQDGKPGFYSDAAAKDSEAAFVTAEAAEAAGAVKFVIEQTEDGKLVLNSYDETGNVTTAIAEIPTAHADTEAVYNLNGVRVLNPVKGLYIQNGKKLVVK